MDTGAAKLTKKGPAHIDSREVAEPHRRNLWRRANAAAAHEVLERTEQKQQ
jgi:hypothetical protein